MAVTEKDYLVLSKLAYVNFDAYANVLALGQTVPINQIDYSQTNQVASWQNYIEPMGDWKLINYVNKNGSSGYCGAAFLNSQTGDIVFASRGTEPYVLQYGMGDIKQDVQLALIGGPSGTNNQFVDSLSFVTDTLSRVSGQIVDRSNLSRFVNTYKVSFTGHSLGGGISEFLTYLTGGRSVTLNGVGIGQAINLDRATASGYNTLHLVISADLTGNYGIPLGQVRSLADDLPRSGPDPGDYIDPSSISRLAQIINRYAWGQISTAQFYSNFSTELVSMNNVTRNYI
ncbi:hypothetical protein, partial [Sporomusa sp.]|uniref:hypothetical protein n=1 Tax=Sporomusa sp. TaxID=2078658 RepID=UPI002C6E2B09